MIFSNKYSKCGKAVVNLEEKKAKLSKYLSHGVNEQISNLICFCLFTDEDETLLTARATSMFFEGSEPSSVSLALALYALAQHPDVQERLHAEIRDKLEEHKGELSFDSFNDIKYLDNVLSEALRFYAPVLYLAKRCTNSYTLPNIGNNPPVTIVPGTSVLIPVQALQS